MLHCRFVLSLRSTCSLSVCVRSSRAARELPALRLHPSAREHKAWTGTPKRAQSRGGLLPARDMQPAVSPYGRGSAAGAADEGDGGDEGGGTRPVGQERPSEEAEIRTDLEKTEQVDLVQERSAAPTASHEKKAKRKTKRKIMKKRLKSDDLSGSLMSELPFALASPTTWKELEFTNSESREKKRKRKRGECVGRVDSEEDGEKKKKKKVNQRPNYFVSIPITNTQIGSAVAEVQEAMLQREPRLAKAMIPVATLHITLLVTHLATQEQVDLAAAVLAQAAPSVAELLGGRDLVLPFSGISHFRKEVVFVGLSGGQHRHTLDGLAELLRGDFADQGLLQGDSHGFEPHLTIMKLSKAPKLRSQGIKKVDPGLYSSYTNNFFGDQTVERLDLCSMLKKKQEGGYYHTEASLPLGGRRRSEPDEAELLRVSRRLVEDAVSRALQQYKQETLQNGGGPNAALQPPGGAEDAATKTDTTSNFTTDNRK